MDFINLAKQRYSCRNYDSKPVPREKLDLVLEAGQGERAASALSEAFDVPKAFPLRS